MIPCGTNLLRAIVVKESRWLKSSHMLPVSFGAPFGTSSSSNTNNERGSSSQPESSEQAPNKNDKAPKNSSSTRTTSKLKTVLAGMRIDRLGYSSAKVSKATEGSKETAETIPRIDPALIQATENLAESLAPKIDPQTVKSELFAKLLDHATQTDKAKKASGDLSHLIAGMKIDRKKPAAEPGVVISSQEHFQKTMEAVQEPITAHMMEEAKKFSDQQPPSDRSVPWKRRPAASVKAEKIDLFGGKPLGVFKNIEAMKEKPQPRLATWELLETEALHSLRTTSPKNPYDEMIRWTKEGKLWHYPINNEQGVLDHEKDVHFTEHIFLNHLIEDFPKRGPLRQFMDIVIYALSRNAFVTVQDKVEYVDWYRQYFKEKHAVLLDVLGPEMSSFTERAQGEEAAVGVEDLSRTQEAKASAARG